MKLLVINKHSLTNDFLTLCLDDADVSEIEVESVKPHVDDEEGKQEDVQSTGSQVGDREASPVYRNSDGSRLRGRFS